jgi:hypothetical protein
MSDTFPWVVTNTTQSYDPELPKSSYDTMSTQEALNRAMGTGVIPVIIAAGESVAGNFYSLYAITESMLSAITILNATGSTHLVDMSLPAQFEIKGSITALTVASGSVICYK